MAARLQGYVQYGGCAYQLPYKGDSEAMLKCPQYQQQRWYGEHLTFIKRCECQTGCPSYIGSPIPFYGAMKHAVLFYCVIGVVQEVIMPDISS